MKQEALTVVTPIDPERVEALSDFLTAIGDDVTRNEHVPFGDLKTVHFARWVILPARESETGGAPYPPQLVYSCSLDGTAQEHVAELLREARAGVDRIYGHCLGFPTGADATAVQVAAYLLGHAVRPSIFFVGMQGLTVARVHEDARLREVIEEHLDAEGARSGHFAGATPADVRTSIREHVAADPSLTREPVGPGPAPFRWYHWAGLVLATLPLLPFVVLLGGLVRLEELGDRRREGRARGAGGGKGAALSATEPHVAPSGPTELDEGPDDPRRRLDENIRAVTEREDQQVQNQLSHVVEVKPGWLRAAVLALILPVLDFGARRIYNQGDLLGVRTLHFVRWVMIDGGRRLMFLTNYDGSMLAYIGDFVHRSWQVPSVLTAIWTNTLRFPPSRWLVLDGARDVPRFTAFLREHAVPTQVWYSAYKGVTAGNKLNNDRIRRGLAGELGEEETRVWLRRF